MVAFKIRLGRDHRGVPKMASGTCTTYASAGRDLIEEMKTLARHVWMGLLVATVACAPAYQAVRYDLTGPKPLREVHQCVTEQVVDHGFYVTETRRDDGVVKAERRTDRWGGVLGALGRDYVEVLIFERQSGESTVQYLAATVTGESNMTAPSPEVEEVARAIASQCAGIEIPTTERPQEDFGIPNVPEGARFVVSVSRRVVYPLRDSCKEPRALPARDLLFYSVLQDALAQGFRVSEEPGCDVKGS